MSLIMFLLMVFGFMFLGMATARWIVDRHWHKRHIHKCGFHTMWSNETNPFCVSCGEDYKPEDWKTKKARARWPLGWEWEDK